MAVKMGTATKKAALKKSPAKVAKKDARLAAAEAILEENAEKLAEFFALKDQIAGPEKVYKKVCAEISEIFNGDPTDTISVSSETVDATFSPVRASTEVVDKESVVTALEELEEGLAFELAKFGITELKQYLPATVSAKVMTTTYSGNRSMKSFKIKD